MANVSGKFWLYSETMSTKSAPYMEDVATQDNEPDRATGDLDHRQRRRPQDSWHESPGLLWEKVDARH
jgi:hypothetical protein